MNTPATESLECLTNVRDHAVKHAEGIADHIRHLENEIRRHEARLKEANRCADLAQAELESSYPQAA